MSDVQPSFCAIPQKKSQLEKKWTKKRKSFVAAGYLYHYCCGGNLVGVYLEGKNEDDSEFFRHILKLRNQNGAAM